MLNQFLGLIETVLLFRKLNEILPLESLRHAKRVRKQHLDGGLFLFSNKKDLLGIFNASVSFGNHCTCSVIY